jgi:hypothetical protein
LSNVNSDLGQGVKDKEGLKAYSLDISFLDLTHTVKAAMASIMAKR